MEQIIQMWKEVVQDETGPGLPVEGAVGSVKEAQCLLETVSVKKETGSGKKGNGQTQEDSGKLLSLILL